MIAREHSRIIAIIPARGGSKGIPKKNIIDFCGKPLIAWSILHAQGSQYVDEVFVSTDDEAIARVSREYGAQVIIRPDELATDTATSESALLHAIDSAGGCELAVFLQATSPVRTSDDIDKAYIALVEDKADSLFSGSLLEDFYIWNKRGELLKSLNFDYLHRKRRQDHEKEFGLQYVENGSFYMFRPDDLKKSGNRLNGRITVGLMELWKSFEIDSLEGLDFCRMIFQNKILNQQKSNI